MAVTVPPISANCDCRNASASPPAGAAVSLRSESATRNADVWSLTDQCVTSIERAPAKKNARASPERLSPPVAPPAPPELHADRITTSASSFSAAISLAVSRAPEASFAPAGTEVTIAGSSSHLSSAGSNAWEAKCRIR